VTLTIFSCSNNKKNEAINERSESRSQENKLQLVFDSEQLVEVLLHDINNDGKTDSIYLLEPSLGDPGIFNKILFRINDDTISFEGKTAWDTLSWKTDNNKISSDKLFLTKSDNVNYFLISGTQYGCCPVQTTIFTLSNRLPKVVFDKEFEISVIEDLDGDGTLEIIGSSSFSQAYQRIDSINGHLGTYSPYKVYEMVNGKIQMDYEQSKRYNQENYLFAGYEYSEEIPIVYYRDGRKPHLLDSLDRYECNTDYLLQMSQSLDNPSEQDVLEFLLTFDNRCNNNVEYSEFSAELLIKLLTKHPTLLIKVWDQNKEVLDHESLISEIRSPLIEPNYDELESNWTKVPPSDLRTEVATLIEESKN
jgi:hypothetical protein